MITDIQIGKNIENILNKINSINKNALLVAITKFVLPEKILIAFNSGICHFGESRIQETQEKINFYEKMRDKIKLHLVGHLQSNKVKKAINFYNYIQSIDSYEIAQKISVYAKEKNKICDVLLEINIGREQSKYGFLKEKLFLELEKFQNLENIRIKGLMTVAPYFENVEDARPYFKEMKNIFDEIKKMNLKNFDMKYLSMGMSNDYIIALEEGANMVRIGTAIFGQRN